MSEPFSQDRSERLEALERLYMAATPFAEIMLGSNGRIPTERLSAAHWHELTRAFAALQVGGPSIPPAHVAWLRYKVGNDGRPTTIHLCDSDSPGAFKVYRHAEIHVQGAAKESTWRRLLAMSYGVTYGDDGELQNNECTPFIDFKRDSALDIERKMHERGLRGIAAALAAPLPQDRSEPILPERAQVRDGMVSEFANGWNAALDATKSLYLVARWEAQAPPVQNRSRPECPMGNQPCHNPACAERCDLVDPPVQGTADDAAAELRNIVNAERFNREHFRDDTEFADWAQNRARHALARAQSGGGHSEKT